MSNFHKNRLLIDQMTQYYSENTVSHRYNVITIQRSL